MNLQHLGEEIWYLVKVLNGFGWMLLLLVLMFWIRLLLKLVEHVVKPGSRFVHEFLGPVPGSPDPMKVEHEPVDDGSRKSHSVARYCDGAANR